MSKLFIFALALTTLCTFDAHAVAPTEKEIQQLRTLSELGQDACQQGEYASCQRAFEQAQDILPWAPHEFYIAEALAGQGKLVEGSALWNKILKENDPDDCHPSVCQAVRKARLRLNQVEPKIPKVSFQLARRYSELRVEWGGAALTKDQLSRVNAVNPGEYQLVATAPEHRTLRRSYRLAPGEEQVVLVELAGDSGPVVSASPSKRPTWPVPVGVALVGAGSAALVGGLAALMSNDAKLGRYKTRCNAQPGLCSRDDEQAKEIEDLSTLKNGLLFGGGALFASGSAVLIWHWSSAESPEAAASPAPRTALRVGLLNATLWGTF